MKAVALAALISLLGTFPSFAETFICNDKHFAAKYEVRGRRLFGYEDDFTGHPNVYEILQNSQNGIIAIRHSPDRLIWMTIGRNGKFVRKLEFVSGSYEESLSGHCDRK